MIQKYLRGKINNLKFEKQKAEIILTRTDNYFKKV